MALARKCDICGRLYEHYGDDGSVVKKSNTIQFTWRSIGNGRTTDGKMYDCCPECMDSINTLIMAIKTEHRD